MKTGMMLSIGAIAVAAVAATAMPAQDAKPATKPAGERTPIAVPAVPGQDAMLDAMKQAATVGEQHKDFAKLVGNWQVQYSCWMDPDGPPQEGSGTSAFEAILGGRYLVEHSSGTMPGMGPFQGMGILGYDNVTGEYQHVWLCDAGTSMMTTRGKPGADGTVSLTGDMVDPQTKIKYPCRVVWTEVSPNERHLEMYCNRTGKEARTMEAVYTRGEVGMR